MIQCSKNFCFSFWSLIGTTGYNARIEEIWIHYWKLYWFFHPLALKYHRNWKYFSNYKRVVRYKLENIFKRYLDRIERKRGLMWWTLGYARNERNHLATWNAMKCQSFSFLKQTVRLWWKLNKTNFHRLLVLK